MAFKLLNNYALAEGTNCGQVSGRVRTCSYRSCIIEVINSTWNKSNLAERNQVSIRAKL